MERRIRTTLWTVATLAGGATGIPLGVAVGLLVRGRQPIPAAVLVVISASTGYWLYVIIARRSGVLARPFGLLARAADDVEAGRVLQRPAVTGDGDIDRIGAVLAAASVGLTERAADREERQRTFANDLSNQLRGPVTNLRLVVEAAERSNQPSHLLTAAHAELDRLQVTVDHLLMLTRDRQPAAGSIALSSVANGAERRWTARATAAGRQLNITADRSLPTVCGSRVDVDQILDALIGNALRHGGGHIFVTTRSIQGGAAIDVADQGAGIPAEYTDRIFFRQRPADDPMTAGDVPSDTVTLATARALAEANGGRLVLSSARPPRFSLILPTTG